MRKARCRAKYGRACPHGGHYGGKRRSSITHAQTHAAKVDTAGAHQRDGEVGDVGDVAKEPKPRAHRVRKRSIADINADA